MLGDPDPEIREAIAVPTLVTWIQRGVYDDLLGGLGDGMAAGLRIGLSGTLGDTSARGKLEGPAEGRSDGPFDDTVFRRSSSAAVLTACIERDNSRPLVPGGKVLEWGDRIATWLLRERDLRTYVPGRGWARPIARGADALAVLAGSPHVSRPELTVVLDVVADRVLARTDVAFGHEETDRLAGATMAVLRRNALPLSVLEPWVERVTAVAAQPADDRAGDSAAMTASANAQTFLRSLHLQLALGQRQPEVRADLLLVVIVALRRTNPAL
jgi:hypothetical protein